MIKIVEDSLPNFRGDACMVYNDETGEFFVVSTITEDISPHSYGSVETLAFRCDEYGIIHDWADVAGGGEMTRDDVLEQLASGDLYDWYSEDESYAFHEGDSVSDEDDDSGWFYSDDDGYEV
jgi:hypothetical protein